MECRRADELLIDFLYQTLDERTRQEFLRHLEDCPAHRLEVEQHGNLLRALRAEPREEPDAALDRRILEEANQARPQTAKAERQPWWTLVFRPSFAAAALLLLLGVGVVVFMRRFQESPPASGGGPGQAIVPATPPPAPPASARALDELRGGAVPSADDADIDRAADAAKPEEKSGLGTAAREAGEGMVRGEKEEPQEPDLAAKDAFERQERVRRVAALAKAPRKGLDGAMDGKAKSIVPGSSPSAASPGGGDAGARGAAGASAEAKPTSAPHPEPKAPDDAQSRSAGAPLGVEEEARFAQPPPAPVVAETAQKEDAAGAKKAEARKVAAQTSAAPASEAPRPAEPSPEKPPSDRDEEQDGRARLQAAKDKASDEAEELRRCVREESGARAADCRYRLFDALFRAGRCAEAVSVAEQAVSAAPADARAADTLLDAASCLENLGRLDRARAFYRRVEKEYPAHANEARRALQRLP